MVTQIETTDTGAASPPGQRQPTEKEIRLVIAASSAGTIFEWYDFFIYGTLAALIGAAFFPSHIAAILFYRRYRRPEPSIARKWGALALFIAVPLVCFVLSGQWTIALYGLALGGMAMAASLSLFPQSRVGLGAMLFVLSDWLIFSRMGPVDLAPLPDLLVWPTYYVGQLLIATGVVQTLRRFRR